MDEQGYLNLKRLISKAYLKNQQRGLPLVKKEWLPEFSAGIIILSGAREGDVGKAILAGNMQHAAECLGFWSHHFNNCYYLDYKGQGVRKRMNTFIKSLV